MKVAAPPDRTTSGERRAGNIMAALALAAISLLVTAWIAESNAARLTGSRASSIEFASIFERSRTSLMIRQP